MHLLRLQPGAKKGISARCRLELSGESEHYTILAGSQAVTQVAPHFPKYCASALKLREELIQRGVLRPAGEHLEFTEDCGGFTASSAAAQVILGCSSDGYTCWVEDDDQGRSLGDLLKKLGRSRGKKRKPPSPQK